MRRTPANPPTKGWIREYNSLEAQRDAGLAFIASQRHEAGSPSATATTTAATPAATWNARRLRPDGRHRGRKIDTVVVYKIDRLTRSLPDFAKLVEVFDRNGVSFVSVVTQQFNTTTSMGRLTLNILLSFAQFEREVTGECIPRQDRRQQGPRACGWAAIRRWATTSSSASSSSTNARRPWCATSSGATAEHGSAARLVRELDIEGHTTKAWVTQRTAATGAHHRPAVPLRCCATASTSAKSPATAPWYPAQHETIVTPALWDAAHAFIERRKQARARARRQTSGAAGGPAVRARWSAHAALLRQRRTGGTYRYYVPPPAQATQRRREPVARARIGGRGHLPAAEIETRCWRKSTRRSRRRRC